jgi:hypothetical protein
METGYTWLFDGGDCTNGQLLLLSQRIERNRAHSAPPSATQRNENFSMTINFYLDKSNQLLNHNKLSAPYVISSEV